MKILEEYGIEEDPRLHTAFREMLITYGVCILYSIVTLAVAWSIGMSKSPLKYSYVLGLPAWWFWGLIVCPLGFFGLVIVLVTCVFKHMSLEPWLGEKREGGKKDADSIS